MIGSIVNWTQQEKASMGKTPDQVPEDKLELYRKLIDTHPEIELQGGMKLPHTSHNGYMYSSLTQRRPRRPATAGGRA